MPRLPSDELAKLLKQKRKYKKACNEISDILQQHNVEDLKFRSNLFYKAYRGVVQDPKEMEAHKFFMNLYRKYISNKKVIDEYQKQQCTPSPPCRTVGYLSTPSLLCPSSPCLPSTVTVMESPTFPPSVPAPTSRTLDPCPPIRLCSPSPPSHPSTCSNPTHVCDTDTTYKCTNQVSVLDTYDYKKAKCNKICIKMKDKTLISWLHNLKTNQKTLTDLDYSIAHTVDRSQAKKINDKRDNSLWSMDFKSDICTCENIYLVMEIPYNEMGDYMYTGVVQEEEMKGMVAFERKDNQIYVAENMHRIFHHTKGHNAVQELLKRYGPNKSLIISNKQDCHGSVPYDIRLNRADIPTVINNYQLKDSFQRSILQTTLHYTQALMLSHEDIMRGIINNGRGDRGTFSIDLGFTSMKGKNLKKDHNNRSTPTLTVSWKKWFKNKDSKKLLGKLAQYVIDHVLPLRFDMDDILQNNDSTFLKDKHMEFAKELGLPTDSSTTQFLVEGVTIGFANRLKNHFDYWNDYRSNRD